MFRFGLGPAIIAAAAWIVFWNEGGAAKQQAGLAEGAATVVTVSPQKLDPANDGRLVHVIGRASTAETLADPLLRVSAANALKLRRQVEMYQWQETQLRKDGPAGPDGKPGPAMATYEYAKIWHTKWINSAAFKESNGHRNPPAMFLQDDSWDAKKVTLGAFELTDDQKKIIYSSTPVKLDGTQATIELLPGQGKIYRDESQLIIRPDFAAVAKTMNDLKFISQTSTQPPPEPPADVLSAPEVGDLKITFVAALPSDYTLIGKQVKNQLLPMKASTGVKLDTFRSGQHSAEDLYRNAASWSSRSTWFFRALALAIIYAGVFITLGPITRYAASISWLRGIVATGMFYVRAGLTLAIGAALVGAAWFYYRPAYAIALFVVAGLFLVLTIWLVARSRRAAGSA